jgi:hypothetical protein
MVESSERNTLFLDFQHAGVVRTAEFTAPTSSAPTATATDRKRRIRDDEQHWNC